jgi:hypothetical protein
LLPDAKILSMSKLSGQADGGGGAGGPYEGGDERNSAFSTMNKHNIDKSPV